MLYQRFFSTFSIISILLFAGTLHAKDLHAVIKLVSIESTQSSESYSDEVYFSVLESRDTGSPEMYRVPNFPLHWQTKDLPNMRDIKLWEGDLQDNQSAQVVLSLIEHDMPPWNVDDHIGSAKVTLKNQKGKIDIKWGQPSFNDQPEVTQADLKVPKYVMMGEGAHYTLQFHVEQYDLVNS